MINNLLIHVKKKMKLHMSIYLYSQYIQLWNVEVPGSINGFFSEKRELIETARSKFQKWN